KSNNPADLIRTKTEFYQILTRGSGNSVVEKLLKTLHNRVNLLRITSMTSKGRLKHSVAEIQAIYGAICKGQPRKAEALCIKHIEAAAKVALHVLATSEQRETEKKSPARARRHAVA